MSVMKTFREKMAEEGLQSFIVTYRPDDFEKTDEPIISQFWAEDAAHAGEQCDDENPFCEVLLVETQDEYETRTGSPMHTDGEVMGVDADGGVICWNADTQSEFNSGMVLASWNKADLTDREKERLRLQGIVL